MATSSINDTISLQGFSLSDFSTWVPTFGNYCGPSWSDGHRLAEGEEATYVVPVLKIDGIESQVDALCREHDIAYGNAANQPTKFYQQLLADVKLLEGLSSLNFDQLSSIEATYASLAAVAFATKIETIDKFGSLIEGGDILLQELKASALSYVDTIETYLSPIGKSFTDEFGKTITYTEDGYIECYTQLADQNDVIFSASTTGDTTIATTSSLSSFWEDNVSMLAALSTDINWDIQASIPSINNPELYVEQLSYNTSTNSLALSTTSLENINSLIDSLLNTPLNDSYFTLNLTDTGETYTIVTKESIEGLIGTDAEAWSAFLEANPWLQVADDYLLFDYSKELIFPESILPETSAGEGHNENFSSPLVLDLNGNGTTSTFIAQSETYFDMDGDGFRERTSWTESSDGLLTLDLNNDGIVTNGGELFGNNTKLANGTTAKDGFEALSQYDLNHDNVIDAKDSIYSHLKVWIDSNSDGISTTDELKTLQELNITSINLNATETSTSEAYNQISDSSSFTQDGQTKTINDVWFYQNKSDTTYDYTTPIKESVAALPTIEGSGRVKDLQDAMNDDTVLEAKVTALLTNASSMSFSNFSSAFNFFTCKTFSIQEALHVKIQIQHKGAESGEEARVA